VVREVSEMTTDRTPRVVVGVDDSLSGLEALRFAVAEARRRGVVLRTVRAWQYAMPWYEQDAGQYRAAKVDAATMMIHAAFQQAMGGFPRDITVEAVAIEGPPARVLVGQAGEPDDLLIVGRPDPGRGWRQRLFRAWHRLTGVSRVDVHCVRIATCPVVTVGAPLLASEAAAGLARDVVGSAEALLRDAAAGRPPERPTQPA
jgi:nucleotide-binding universal stress UspA family protein